MAGHEEVILSHSEEFKRINKRLEKAEELIDTIRMEGNTRLIMVEDKVDEYGKRLEQEEIQTKAMLEIAYSVRGMTDTLEKVVAQQGAHEKLLSDIQNKPGQLALKGWVFVLTIVGTAIVTGLIGLVIGTLNGAAN